MLIENGNYIGFGFVSREESIGSLDLARNFVKPSKDNRVVQNLVNSYLLNPRGAEVVAFGS